MTLQDQITAALQRLAAAHGIDTSKSAEPDEIEHEDAQPARTVRRVATVCEHGEEARYCVACITDRMRRQAQRRSEPASNAAALQPRRPAVTSSEKKLEGMYATAPGGVRVFIVTVERKSAAFGGALRALCTRHDNKKRLWLDVEDELSEIGPNP